jgi:hypothetical protein
MQKVEGSNPFGRFADARTSTAALGVKLLLGGTEVGSLIYI